MSGRRVARGIGVQGLCLVLSLTAGAAAIAATDQGTTSQPTAQHAAPAKSGTPAQTSSAKQPSAAKYADQPFIYEDTSTSVSFRSDGTSTTEEQASLLVQSEAAVQKLGVLDFYYDGGKQQVEIQSVQVRKPDGSVVAAGANDIFDLPAPVSQQAPLFSDFRIKEVTVRGLAPGDVLEYQATIQTKKATIPGQFWYECDFVRNGIALSEELRITVPAGRKVILKSRHVQPTVSTAAGRRIYYWKTDNLTVQQDRAGKLEPPPSVLLSTFQSWAEVGSWWASLADPPAKPTPAIRAEAAQLTRHATSEQERLFDIYQYVATQFRYISVSFGLGHYKPHEADHVLQNGFGDCKDKATLLVSLLDAAGIPSYSALVNSSRQIDPTVPSPGQFDHVINIVPESPAPVWLDTTSEVAPMGLVLPSLRGSVALVMPPKKSPYLTKIPVEPPFASLQEMDVDAKLDPQGTLTAKMKWKIRGDVEVIYRELFRNLPQPQWQVLVQRLSYLMNYGGTVSDVVPASTDDLATPFSYSYDYTRKNYSDWAYGHITMPLPPFDLPSVPAKTTKPGPPVKLGAPGQIVYRATVRLPKDYQPQLPKPVQLHTSFATYRSTYSYAAGTITADRKLTVLLDTLPASNLDAYKKFRDAVDADDTAYIQLSSLSAENDRKADDLLSQASQSLQDRNWPGARDLYHQALGLDPQVEGAWLGIAEAYDGESEFGEALGAARKEIAAHPDEGTSYDEAARLAFIQRHDDESLADSHKMLELSPQDAMAHALIASVFDRRGQYSQAAQELARAIALDPHNHVYPFALAYAYLKTGDVQKALAAFGNAAKVNPVPIEWDTIAQTLAGADTGLSAAHSYAEMAVTNQEEATAHLSLDQLKTSDLKAVNQLARSWEILGEVDYLQGDLADAARYLRATWTLSQDPEVGYQFGQVEEKLGRRRTAIRVYAMAKSNPFEPISAPLTPSAEITGLHEMIARVNETGSALEARLEALLGSAGRADAAVNDAVPQLMAVRTAKVPFLVHKNAEAEFFLLQSPPDGAFTEVQFISGDKALTGGARVLAGVKIAQPFPDDHPVRIVRRGVLSCSPALMSYCQLILYTPDAVHSIH